MLVKQYLTRAGVAFAVPCIALLFAACGGPQATPANPVDDAQLNAVLPPLSEIDALTRTVSEDVELSRLGSEAYTQSGGATEDGDDLLLATAEGQPLEWGMYLFQLTDKIPKHFDTSATVNGGKYWLAIGNFGTGLWELVGPLEDETYQFSTLPANNYKSDGNAAVLAILVGRTGGEDADIAVHRVSLTAGGGTSPEL